MTIHVGNLLTFSDIVLIKNVSAGPPPPKYVRTIYNVLPAGLSSFNCVWADVISSQGAGKVYFSKADAVYVVNLAENCLYQYITTLDNNVTGEVLLKEDIVDLNIIN